MAVSAVLITTGLRNESVSEVVKHLSSFNWIDEIIISYDREERAGSYQRYEAVKRAKNEWIYVQDDDCIIQNAEEIYDNRSPERITLGMKQIRWSVYSEEKSKMVGWGAVFKKELIENMKPYFDKYGVDDLYKRESDRVFTYCNQTKMILANVMDFKCALSSTALCLQDNHESSKQEILERLKTL